MGHTDFIGYDNEKWPSVTTVLSYPPKPWLKRWKEKWGIRAEQKVIAANKIGTAFHKAVEKHCLKLPGEFYTQRLAIMFTQFLKWYNESGLRTIETELHVSSERYHYHGTFDAVGYLGDKPKTLCIFDWKTSSGIYPDMELQLAAYAQAYFEQTGIRVKRAMIVHVSKDKPNHKLTVKEYKLGKRSLNKFLKRLELYREAKGE